MKLSITSILSSTADDLVTCCSLLMISLSSDSKLLALWGEERSLYLFKIQWNHILTYWKMTWSWKNTTGINGNSSLFLLFPVIVFVHSLMITVHSAAVFVCWTSLAFSKDAFIDQHIFLNHISYETQSLHFGNVVRPGVERDWSFNLGSFVCVWSRKIRTVWPTHHTHNPESEKQHQVL